MFKNLLLFFGTLVASYSLPAQSNVSIPYFLGGFETVFGKQYETAIMPRSHSAEPDVETFWRTYSPNRLKREVTEFLKKSKGLGFVVIDPDQYEMNISAIRMEHLPGESMPPADWYVIVELMAWGKEQHSGVPLCFQLVMLPGEGFKVPTLKNRNTLEPNHSPEPAAQ